VTECSLETRARERGREAERGDDVALEQKEPQDAAAGERPDGERGERRESQGQAPTAEETPLMAPEGVNEGTAELLEEAPEAEGGE
jgi:hypothetical protein